VLLDADYLTQSQQTDHWFLQCLLMPIRQHGEVSPVRIHLHEGLNRAPFKITITVTEQISDWTKGGHRINYRTRE